MSQRGALPGDLQDWSGQRHAASSGGPERGRVECSRAVRATAGEIEMDNGAEQEILEGQVKVNDVVAKDGIQDMQDLLDKGIVEKVLYVGDKGGIVDFDECRAER
mmetsp:Transcript_20108/g.52551  ORF Transcript_20108/g.52551 Transcript_20108/m.52551 type:complete len:105 (+) Transcript_20108:812-1126(+)